MHGGGGGCRDCPPGPVQSAIEIGALPRRGVPSPEGDRQGVEQDDALAAVELSAAHRPLEFADFGVEAGSTAGRAWSASTACRADDGSAPGWSVQHRHRLQDRGRTRNLQE